METSQIEIVNKDKSTNQINLYTASSKQNPVFVIFPAMGVRASYYELLAEKLVQHGFNAATVDLRGNGNSSIRPSGKVDFTYQDQLEQDYSSSLQKIKKVFPSNKIFLLGHSLGGQLGTLFASRYTGIIDGLILIACCSVYYKGWNGFQSMKTYVGTQFSYIIAMILGYFPGKKIGFGGLEAKGVIKDWSQQARSGKYILAPNDFDYEAALKKLKIPVLALSFQSDTLAPQKAVQHLCSKLGNQDLVKHLHLLNSDTRNDHFSHFNWVKKSDNIITIIAEWLNK